MTALIQKSTIKTFLFLFIGAFFLLAVDTISAEFEWEGVTYISGLKYQLYHGENWSSLPDFSQLMPFKVGEIESFKLDIRDRDDNFAVVFEGVIRLPKDGEYTFYLTSDDGSKLFIDGKELVNNDGLHGREEKSGTIKLKKGIYSIKVQFFEAAGEEILEVKCKGPDIEKQDVPAKALFHKK